MSQSVAGASLIGPDFSVDREAGQEVGLVASLLWIAFIFGISKGVSPLFPNIVNVERFFWFPADLAVVFWFLLFPAKVINVVLRHKLLLFWGVLACLSSLWSFTPVLSLYHGVQLILTVMVGLLITSVAPRMQVIKLLFFSLLLYQLLSFLLVLSGQPGAVSIHGEWMGAAGQKNQLGIRMGLHLITCLALFLSGWRPVLSGLAGVGAFALLVLSESTTSILTCLLAISVIPLAFLYRLNSKFLSLSVGLAIVGISISGALMVALDINPLSILLEAVGKDATLTGRTEIWAFGFNSFKDHPWLGIGYSAYWNSEYTTYLNLQYALRQELNSFHNALIEMTVAMGVVGLVMVLATLAIAFFRAIREYLTYLTFGSLWPLSIIIMILVHMLSESMLARNHSIGLFLFVLAATSKESLSSQRS